MGPSSRRGRISALEQVVGVAGPDLGNARAGAIAPLVGVGPAMVIGSLASFGAASLIYLCVPRLRH